MVDLERIEVRGGVVRLDLRCTECEAYIGDRIYAEPAVNGTRWPRLGALIRQASGHECPRNEPIPAKNRTMMIDRDR